MKHAFLTKRFNSRSANTVKTVNTILTEYAAAGYIVTLRQLYYQLVARNYIENTEKSYKNLGQLVNDARLAGLIDWAAICDRGRETTVPPAWRDMAHILSQAAQQFAIDKWADQPNYVELMVEKQALEGVLEPVCLGLQIRFTANKGYSSASALYETGAHLHDQYCRGKRVHVLYLGDHDPSGLDMTRDVQERLTLFSGVPVTVHRLALNMEQVEEMRPPENPAKTTDTRFHDYARRFGTSSWELDAIEPRRLAQMVTHAVESLRDGALWEIALQREQGMRGQLARLAKTGQDRESGAESPQPVFESQRRNG
jgi:hypothetical protein